VSLEGRRKIAEGREAEIFDSGDGAVLKLYRNAGMGHEAEAAALSAISSAGGLAPRLLGRVEIDGRPGLLIERIAGVDMLVVLEKNPWRLAPCAKLLADSQADIHRIPAPVGVPDTKVLLDLRIRAAPIATELRTFALERLRALPDGDRLCHGDFHPGNILVSDGKAAVIDWSSASRGDPAVDVARTKLLLTLGEPLAPSAWMRAIIRVGRGWFERVYARRYETRITHDAELLKDAFVVNAAARLWEQIEGEEATLVALITKARAAKKD
jgi:aminoglycoside phosphotransferase (APT) family kinase protein